MAGLKFFAGDDLLVRLLVLLMIIVFRTVMTSTGTDKQCIFHLMKCSATVHSAAADNKKR